MAKKKQPDLKKHYGENNSGHYNFVIIDRELIFVTDKQNRNLPSSLNLSLEALGLYTVLKAHAIDKNYVWPSLSTLETLTGKSDKTILIYIQELIDKGLIIKEKAKNPRGGREINIYVLPAVDKELIKNQSGNIPYCDNQSGNSPDCKAEILPDDKAEIFRSKETKLNILTQLRLKAQIKDFPSEIEDGFNKLIDTIKSDPRGDCFLTENNLVIKYRYEIAIRRDVNILLDAVGLYDKINVVYET